MARIINDKNIFVPFPDDYFSLGKLCLRGHDHENSGKSFRYTRADGSLGNCVKCSRDNKNQKNEIKRKSRLESMPPDGFKKCKRCSEVKKLDLFRRKTNGSYGYCKLCANEYASVYIKKKPANERKETNRIRRINNWMVHLLSGTRSSAKKRNLQHNIKIEDIKDLWEKQNKKCYWLGLDLGDYSLPKRHPLRPSLDRLDCNEGYVLGNVVFTCNFANMGRSSTTFNDFSDFISILKKHMKNGKCL